MFAAGLSHSLSALAAPIMCPAGAAAFRDKLCSAQLDDEASVLQANVEFSATRLDFVISGHCGLARLLA